MKIIVVATTPFSMGRGSHIRILHEAIAIAKAGHSIEILTYSLENDPIECKENGIKISRIPNLLPWYTKTSAGQSWGKIFLDKILFFKLLFRTLLQKPDVLYAHGYEAVIAVFFVQKILFFWNIKTVGDFQGSLVMEMIAYGGLRKKFLRNFFRFIERIIHQMPDCVIASSRSLAEYISKDRKNKCEILYDAPSIPFVSLDKNKLREKYNIPQDLFVILYTGGFTKDKGIGNLLSIIRSTRKDRPCEYLWVIAGGPKEELLIQENVLENIRIISPLDVQTLQELLSLADCAIDPKERISLQGSGKIVNYMQYSLPIFCFDDTVSRDYLGDEIADLYTGKTIDNIAQKIPLARTVLASGGEISIKEKIQNRARTFSWEQVLRSVEN